MTQDIIRERDQDSVWYRKPSRVLARRWPAADEEEGARKAKIDMRHFVSQYGGELLPISPEGAAVKKISFNGQTFEIRPGDWVVYEDRQFRVYSDDGFDDRFQPAPLAGYFDE